MSEEEIEVGEYMRTKDGFIRKVGEIDRCQECRVKVINLIETYRKNLFQFGISIEYRDEDNYFIQESKYKSYDDFIKYDSCKNKTIIDWFISDNKKIVIRVGDIE